MSRRQRIACCMKMPKMQPRLQGWGYGLIRNLYRRGRTGAKNEINVVFSVSYLFVIDGVLVDFAQL